MCLLALLHRTSYPILVHRLTGSFRTSSPRSVALTLLHFLSLAVVSSREDFHLQDRAHAGRTYPQRSEGRGFLFPDAAPAAWKAALCRYIWHRSKTAESRCEPIRSSGFHQSPFSSARLYGQSAMKMPLCAVGVVPARFPRRGGVSPR